MKYKLVSKIKNKDDLIIDGEAEDEIIHIVIDEREGVIYVGRYKKEDLGC